MEYIQDGTYNLLLYFVLMLRVLGGFAISPSNKQRCITNVTDLATHQDHCLQLHMKPSEQ